MERDGHVAHDIEAREHDANLTPSPARSSRVALFDNIKGILMLLVVFGHIMHPVHNTNPALSACFDVIYLFHMPLFVLVSGLFAKGAYRNGKLNVNRIIGFLVLGFIYQLALAFINGARFTPARICAFTSAPWYLISMAYWYALTPILTRLGAVRGMAASLALSLLWGMADLSTGFLAISRTAAFLPCFALGYYLEPATLERVRTKPICTIAVVLSAGFVLARILNEHAYAWFFPMVYGDNPYAVTLLAGMAQKLTAFAVGAICSLAVLKLTPANASWLTTLGRRTLQVYVLHRLIRAWLTFHTPLYDWAVMNDPVWGTLVALVITLAVTALCAIPIFEKPFARFLKIRWIPAR